jgi:hypothetical protein
MFRDVVLWFVSMFLVQPFEQRLTGELAARGAPPALVQELRRCAVEAAPRAADRALSDWGWAVGTGVRLAIGTVQPAAVVAEVAPACARPVEAGLGLLRGARGGA